MFSSEDSTPDGVQLLRTHSTLIDVIIEFQASPYIQAHILYVLTSNYSLMNRTHRRWCGPFAPYFEQSKIFDISCDDSCVVYLVLPRIDLCACLSNFYAEYVVFNLFR